MKDTTGQLQRVTFQFPVKLARRLKIAAAALGTTQTKIARQAIEQALDKICDEVGPIAVGANPPGIGRDE